MNNTLKISGIIFIQFMMTISVFAQNDVTKFLGIPVDGNKPEMIMKLKEKGFVSSSHDKDILVGEFNGTEVDLHVVTNNNKVWRIMISDVIPRGEIDIRIRFNMLCKQFLDNERYLSSSLLDEDYIIPDDEDIRYGMSIQKKRYEASFFQQPIDLDSTALMNEIQDILFEKYTEEELSNLTEEEQKDLVFASVSYIYDKLSKKSVWFMISELYGKYYITMYYDNEYNRASGEDL